MASSARERWEDIIRGIAEYPTSFKDRIDLGAELCCRLHGPSLLNGDMHFGKYRTALGKHPAIHSYHLNGSKVCHLRDYTKDRDILFVKEMHEPTDEFLDLSWGRGEYFRKRYMSGDKKKVSFSTYGAGYCALKLFHKTVMSRTARVLGPNCLVSDALRVFLFAGLVEGKNAKFCEVKPGVWHVADSPVRLSHEKIALFLFDIVKKNPYAIIGNDEDQSSVVKVLAFDSVCSYVRGGTGRAFNFTVIQSSFLSELGVADEGRRRSVVEWFSRKGVNVEGTILDQIMVATVAASGLRGDSNRVKSLIRSWAILGDVVMKKASAEKVISYGGEPVDYTNDCLLQTDKNLSVVFVKSGMRDISMVEFLNEDSKYNATIVESVCGLLYAMLGEGVCYTWLRSLGILVNTDKQLQREVRTEEVRVTPSLNSRQYAKFLALYNQGVFD